MNITERLATQCHTRSVMWRYRSRPLSAAKKQVLKMMLVTFMSVLAGSVHGPLTRTAHAQGVSSERAFINDYARPGRPTMTIYAWGAVGRSGIWRVERDVGIIEFLSAANVPGLGTDQVDTRERYLLRMYREEGSGRTQVYEGQLEEVIEDTGQVPALQDGDVLVLERQQERRWSFRTIAQYVGTASSIALLLLRLNVI